MHPRLCLFLLMLQMKDPFLEEVYIIVDRSQPRESHERQWSRYDTDGIAVEKAGEHSFINIYVFNLRHCGIFNGRHGL